MLPAANTLEDRVLLSIIFISWQSVRLLLADSLQELLNRKGSLLAVLLESQILLDTWGSGLTYTASSGMVTKKRSFRKADLVFQKSERVRKDTCSLLTVLCWADSVN